MVWFNLCLEVVIIRQCIHAGLYMQAESVSQMLLLTETHLDTKSLREGDHFSGCFRVGGGSRTILVRTFNRCSP